jgi:HPt (histidine-containing phosphotransfer) domain-containing protein
VIKRESIDRLLDSITNKIIAYEPGDVMTLSDITELLGQLGNKCPAAGYEKKICSRLEDLVRKALSDSYADFTEELSEGVDLLRSVAENDPVPVGKQKQVESWLSGRIKKRTLQDLTAARPAAAAQEQTEDCPSRLDGDQLQQFVSDCEERLTSAQDLILGIEENPDDGDAVRELFRIFHTIKGECGFLKLSRLGILAHNAESLLDDLRSGRRETDESVINILLEGFDRARDLITALGNRDFDTYADVPVQEFIEKLSQFTRSGGCSVHTAAQSEESLKEKDSGSVSARKEPAVLRRNRLQNRILLQKPAEQRYRQKTRRPKAEQIQKTVPDEKKNILFRSMTTKISNLCKQAAVWPE